MTKKQAVVMVAVVALCLVPSLTLAKVGISFRVQGGLNWLKAGDVNPGTKGLFDWFRDYYNPTGGPVTPTGGYKAVHYGYEFGGDVIFDLSKNIGIGIGAGYLQTTTKSSTMSLAGTFGPGDDWTESVTANPKLTAIPVRLNLFLTFPLGRKFNFTANAGATYYYKAKYTADMRMDYAETGGSPYSFWEALSTRTERKNAFGFQGGLGLEYKMSRSIALFIEAEGSYAKFKGGFEGTSEMTDSSGGDNIETGKLYYLQTTGGGPSSVIMVQSTPPTPGPGEVVREAILDYSRISLMIGLRFRF